MNKCFDKCLIIDYSLNMNSIIQYAHGTKKQVKNLGWLLRNWQKVESLTFEYEPDITTDGKLVANLKDGRKFITDYSCLFVCWSWLNRPVFRGINFTCRQMGYFNKQFVIGDKAYLELYKLDYNKFYMAVIS